MKRYFKSLSPLFLAALTGCQTPDLKPFADSTAAMNSAVKGGQKVFVGELLAIKAADPTATYIDKSLTDFTNHWSQRLAVMDAMVEYSEQLAAVADAPRQRAENTKAVGDAVGKVSAAFGPYGAAVTGAIDIVRKVDGLAAQARAAHTLQEAVEKADPVLTNVVVLLSHDFKKMEETLRLARITLPGILKSPHGDALEARKKLTAFTTNLYSKLLEVGSTNGSWEQAAADFNKETAETAKALASMDRWYLPLTAQLKESDTRIAAGLSLLTEAQIGLKRWGEVHAKLAQDISNNRQPNWRLLLETARAIQEDIERIKQNARH